MTRRSTEAATQDWDDERIALRVSLKIAEERGYARMDQLELSRRITELDKKIAGARGRPLG